MSIPDLYSELSFHNLVYALEGVQSTNLKEEKKNILNSYLTAFHETKQQFLSKNNNKGYTSIYPILRLLLPIKDKVRNYGIRKASLAQLYINILGLGEQSSDATLLKKGTLGKIGTDFADLIFIVMQHRSVGIGSLKINDINTILDKLSTDKKSESKVYFANIFPKMTALEHKWLIRFVLKKLRLGLNDLKILEIFHPKGPHLFKNFNSLEKVCEIFESNENIIEQVFEHQTVEPMIFVRPQLCSRFFEKQIHDIFNLQQNITAEIKMDGERLQLHRKGNNYKYFTRQGNDCSSQFGVDNVSGNFTQFIHDLFKIEIKDMILDGEMMVWDKISLRFITKGENIAARTMKDLGKYQPCYVVYDILYLNGESMIQKSYTYRENILNKLFEDFPGLLIKVKKTKVRSHTEVLDFLNQAINDKEEGIVLKEDNSMYYPGKRKWFKLKPDYLGHLITDLDLVIVGASFRKDQSIINKYFVAVRDESFTPIKYVTVSVIVNHLKYEESKSLQNYLISVMKTYSPDKVPSYLDFGKYTPEVYIKPSESVIVQVKASELQESRLVTTGYILRFPRITFVRYDKLPTDCCDLTEFHKLCQLKHDNWRTSKVIKLTKRYANQIDLDNASKSIKRQKIEKFNLVNNFIYKPVNDIVPLDEIAKGLKICILNSGKGFLSKDKMEKLIKMHGGQEVAYPSRDTFFCVADIETPFVRTIIEKRSHTIVKVPWFLKAFPMKSVEKKLLNITPRDTICITPKFELQLSFQYDEFNDNFTRELTKPELIQQLKEMDHVFSLLGNEYAKLESKIIDRSSIYNICRGQFAYFDTDIFEFSNYKTAKLVFIARGGYEIKDLTEIRDMVKIVVDRQDQIKCLVIKERYKKGFQKKFFQFLDYKYYLQILKGYTPTEQEYWFW
uniref:DNA ligase 4 n=1 Tax=Culicoides sonorensis TaxID=179676 RepID=A0A336LUL2_CULSO